MAQVCQGIAAFRAPGAVLYVPYLCTVLADVAAHLGHLEDGLQALAGSPYSDGATRGTLLGN
jgi:hypothetical protein